MDLVDRAYIVWERTNQPRRYRARLAAGLESIRGQIVKTKKKHVIRKPVIENTPSGKSFS